MEGPQTHGRDRGNRNHPLIWIDEASAWLHVLRKLLLLFYQV
jgi:hypothetical protein